MFLLDALDAMPSSRIDEDRAACLDVAVAVLKTGRQTAKPPNTGFMSGALRAARTGRFATSPARKTPHN